MYDTLYTVWLKEKQNEELQKLPKDFYAKLSEYTGRIRQEGRMLDQKSAKALLVSQELANVKRLLEELATLRFRKIVKNLASAKSLKKEELTSEEERMLLGLRPVFESFQSFLKDSSRGMTTRVEEQTDQSKKMLVRFLREAPAIVGADLKVYGPFSIEDVATLPVENARVLIKHNIAMQIETR
jgi:DNA replication initiation complex subunit (GINS family)